MAAPQLISLWVRLALYRAQNIAQSRIGVLAVAPIRPYNDADLVRRWLLSQNVSEAPAIMLNSTTN